MIDIWPIRTAILRCKAKDDRTFGVYQALRSADPLLKDKAIGDEDARQLAWLKAVCSLPQDKWPEELAPALTSARELMFAHQVCKRCGAKGATEHQMPDGLRVYWCSSCEERSTPTAK